jgi:hypothetical protein
MFRGQTAPTPLIINGEPVFMSSYAVMGAEMIDPGQRTRPCSLVPIPYSLSRFPDWQSRLGAYLNTRAAMPFRYGSMDCGLFVAGAIETMTGVDVAAELRGYRNRTEAFTRIRNVCGRRNMAAIADHLAAQFSIPEVPVLCAQRGDAVQCRTGRLGIVAMHGTEILTPYKDGLLRLPLVHAVRAWHI